MVLVIHRDLRRDEHGVASTVGTIMALLVFLTFLSLIVNQYVPVWMKDSEASHMDTLVGQFADIKGAIDFQVLGALMAQNAGPGGVFVPSTTSTPVTLGVDGVPIFSSPTTGVLNANPNGGPWNVSFSYKINGVATSALQTASGQLDLTTQNRYYLTGDIVYENGAVIRSQSDGQVVRAAPIFQVTPSATNLSVAFELVNLYGSGSASGITTQTVDTKVIGVNQQVYNGLTKDLFINHTSAFGLAWFTFFNTTLSTSLKVTSFTYSSAFGNTQVTANLPGTTMNIYTISMNFIPATGLYALSVRILSSPLSLSFTLQQAFVNVNVGQSSNGV
jgi:hypothetical protein